MKKIMILIITLLLAVSFAGCSLDSLAEYRKAAEKTDQIKKGQTTGEFSMSMEFNTDGMTEEEIKELNYFKDMKGSFNAAFDEEEDKGIYRNYLSFGGLGFDFDLFMNGEEMFMKLPVMGKYMRFDDLQASMAKEQPQQLSEFISKETLDEVNEYWLGILKQEDIFRGKDIALTTPDGEVKTTEYTIRLNDEQLKALAGFSIEKLSKDEKLAESYDKYVRKNLKTDEDKSLEEMLAELKKNLENMTVENFSYTAYVDIDGYIVNEATELSIKVKDSEPKCVTAVNYKLELKNWDINKEQKFEFPELTEENTVDSENMDKDMPFMIDDLLNKKGD